MFNNILGNDEIKELLIKSVKNRKISHSYLFVGTEGIGKKLIALEFAKMILCVDNNKPCNKCKSCMEFDTDNNPDFKIIEPDGNSIKIEQIREFQSKVSEKPIISDKKVYIINDSHKMTQEAQNCLLKTLEEPPEYVTIILVGASESSFLSTIKSRCMIMHFNNIKNELIKQYLQKNYSVDINSDIMINAFQGSIGRAILLKEKQEQYESIEKLLYSLETKDKIDIINMAEIIYKLKEEKNDLLDYMNVVLINLAKESNKYADCISIVEDAKRRLQFNSNYDMTIDNLVFSLWERVNFS